MARTAYAVTKFDKTTGIIDMTTAGVKQAIAGIQGAGNGVSVTNAFNTMSDSLHLYVTNTYAGVKKVSLLPGVYPNAILGQLDISIPASTGEYKIKVNQPDRFMQKDGSLIVEFEAGMTGNFTACAEGTAIG